MNQISGDQRLIAYLNLKLREIGQPGVTVPSQDGLSDMVDNFLNRSREKDRALESRLCPVDQRIQNFLIFQVQKKTHKNIMIF